MFDCKYEMDYYQMQQLNNLMETSVETYQFASKPGDIVILPNGELGIITGWDVFYWKVLYVYPLFAGVLKRLFWRLTNRYEYADEQINELVKLCDMGESTKEMGDLVSFIIPNLWGARLLAEKELNRLCGLVGEEDFRKLERGTTTTKTKNPQL